MPRCEQCDKDFSTDEAFQQHNADKHGSGQTRHEIKQLKRQEKEEKKKTEHEKSSRKRKIRMITVIAAVILGMLGMAAFVIFLPKPEVASSGIGAVGSTHQHADFKVYINGEQLDFTSPRYQVKAREVHVEGGDDDVVHKHATGVTVGHFLKTLGFKTTSTCITTDMNVQYCSNENATLKYFIKKSGQDWESTNDLSNYEIHDLDKYLVTFGNDSPSAIADQQASVTEKAPIESGKGPKQSMPI